MRVLDDELLRDLASRNRVHGFQLSLILLIFHEEKTKEIKAVKKVLIFDTDYREIC